MTDGSLTYCVTMSVQRDNTFLPATHQTGTQAVLAPEVLVDIRVIGRDLDRWDYRPALRVLTGHGLGSKVKDAKNTHS